MKQKSDLEVWQRGPIDDVPPLLQPVAHALLQAVEDIDHEMETFPLELLWEKPGGVASVAFHIKHVRGVIDRLFTYARGEVLTQDQLAALKEESAASETNSSEVLVRGFRLQVEKAIDQLKNTSEHSLNEKRFLGRKQIPTTVIGLLFHAAEHVQRHVGQLIVTARVQKARK